MIQNRKPNSRSWVQLSSLSLIGALLLAACALAATPAPAAAPMSAPAQSAPITGSVWQWTTLVEGGKTTTVPNPESYTIIFYTDGTVTGKADWNHFNGTDSQ